MGSTAPVPKKAQSPLKGDSLAGPSANGHTSEGYAAALVDWENDFIAEHRRHIEETMRLVRQEMGVLSQVMLFYLHFRLRGRADSSMDE